MIRHMSFLLAALSLLLAATGVAGAERYEVVVEHGAAIRMRDGTALHADIYRPKAEGRFPVLLQRTPYNKSGGDKIGQSGAARGYVVIIQDCRGRYTSEGEWHPFEHESDDGYDTVEWTATLPYSDGKVGMFGGSYVGATQVLAAIAHPPHLAGIFPVVTASNYHDGWTYQGGAFEQWFNESWTSGLAQDTLNRRTQQATNAQGGVWKLPLNRYTLFNFGEENPLGVRSLAPYFLDWLAHPSYDDYWKRLSIEDHHRQITVPVYSVAAWYDIFLGGSLRNYQGIRDHGGSEAARRGQRLLVVIGGHAGSGRKIGEVDFGPQAELDEDEVMLRWYDHILRNVRNGVEAEKPVKIFVMGKNVWREEDDWPLPRAESTRYYLHSRGKSNSLAGDGSLSPEVPGAEPENRFVYDPDEPVITIGGPLCCDSAHLAPGPRDQRAAEERDDVLVYTTPAFNQDFEVTGPASFELYASSSAVDTDFTAKLVDVWPNGFAQNLTEGIARARYRDSQERPKFMTPGQVYKFTLDLWATSNVFLAGHKLRLEVSSSNFPRFDRNMNTGGDQAGATRSIKAVNTVYHDREHPSALVLPVVREEPRTPGPARRRLESPERELSSARDESPVASHGPVGKRVSRRGGFRALGVVGVSARAEDAFRVSRTNVDYAAVDSGRGRMMQGAAQGPASPGGTVEIKMTARKYRFDPDVITVKEGQHVRLIITALDRDHGFKLAAFNINQRLTKGDPATIEFTPNQAGTFPFQCSVVCGLGHHKMKGKLVVEEH